MPNQRLIAIGRAIAAAVRNASYWAAACAAAAWAHLRSSAWLRSIAQPFVWLATGIIAFALATVAFLHRLLVPKADTLFDVVKHYVSVIFAFMALTALLWAAKQIAYPPIVITVAKLPEPLEKDYWLNPEISRTLIDQIERMRAVVKGERDPAFDAVLNPPNIIVKSGEWSLNVQEQLLTPLGALLGRSHGEVHLALTCYLSGCARASDSECREPVSPAVIKADAPSPATSRQYLCLRVTADIQRGTVHRRVTSRLTLDNDSYDPDMTTQMAKIAEEVTSVADPATAALYFYRRVKQEGPASRSITNDPHLVADLRGEAFKAAAQAEAQDSFSECYAHSVRAHLTIDRGEFTLAETYIARARAIPRWRHLARFTLPFECRRLVAVAEMALARQLAQQSKDEAYPSYPENTDGRRRLAAFRRIGNVLGDFDAAWGFPFGGHSEKIADLRQALVFARAEIGLAWFTSAGQCGLGGQAVPAPLQTDAVTDESGENNAELRAELETARTEAWDAIRQSVGMLRTLHRPLSPLAHQGALDFFEGLSRNNKCPQQVQALAEPLYRNHPNDPDVARLLAGLIEISAIAADDDGTQNAALWQARTIYQRIVDIGDKKTGVFALGRLAVVTNAVLASGGGREDNDFAGPDPELLQSVRRAWQQYQRELYPTDIRHHAEFILSYWGALLLAADSRETAARPSPDAIARRAEFQRAVQILFPEARPAQVADFPALKGIGTRIACLCLLSRMTLEKSAGRFLTTVNKWQQRGFGRVSDCAGDVLASIDTPATTPRAAGQTPAPAEPEETEEAIEDKKRLEEAGQVCRVPIAGIRKSRAR